mmetsp:Transcript_43771/g.56124  ORF Transcript_43771/g.56124 Transcript_43771/m.56124 type:complete len:98 (-) Transcript_43771:675-968(-)
MSGISKFDPTIADVVVLMVLFQKKVTSVAQALMKIDIASSSRPLRFVKTKVFGIIRSLTRQVHSIPLATIDPSSLADLLTSPLWVKPMTMFLDQKST